MKNILLFTLFLACSFFSCQNDKHARNLINQGEALLATQPDSTYILLDSIAAPDILSDRLLSRWCMAYGKAADKLHEGMPYVSQLTRAFAWYKKHGTPEEQAQIGLFLGRSYAEDKQYLQAANAYSEALAIAENAHIYNVAGYICSYMADLYDYKDQSSEEHRKFEEAARYFEKAGNKRSYAFALRDIAKTWAFDDSSSLALNYMLKADSIVNQLNDSAAISSISNGLGIIYKKLGQTKIAEKHLFKSIAYNTIGNGTNYLALSDLYYNSNKFDTARYYLNKIDDQPTYNQYTPVDALYMRYLIEKESGEDKHALEYLEQYTTAHDSLYQDRSQADIINAEKRYNQLLLLSENKELQIQKFTFLILFSLSFIAGLFVLILYQRKDRKRLRKINEQQQLLDSKENRLHQLKEMQKIEEEKRIAEKKETDKDAAQKEEQAQAEIFTIQQELFQIKKEKLEASTVIKRLKKQAQKVEVGGKNKLTPKDWNNLQETINAIYQNVSTFLYTNPDQLTPAEIENCYLCFLQLGVNEEATLLGINTESVSRRRFRTRQKLNLANTDTELFDYLVRR